MLKRNPSNPDRRRRRSTVAEVTHKLELDAAQLEYLIMNLADQCSDNNLRTAYKARFFGLTDRAERQDDTTSSKTESVWTREELCDIISALQELLSSVQEPSSTLVAEVHSTIGIIHQRLHHDARATQSFLQALWVQTATDDVSPVTLGLTKMRLALAYGRKGQNQEAVNVLQSCMADFEKGGLGDDHELVLKASEALDAFQTAIIYKLHRPNSRRISQGAA